MLLLASKTRLRMPPVVWPLAGFLGWTVLSILASDDPASGWPQIKKFFVFTILLLIYSLFPKTDQARRLMEAWFVCTLFASVWSIVQFVQTWLDVHGRGQDFYQSYVGHRISGFFSHWVTFSEVTLLVFLVLLSYLMFSAGGGRRTRAIWFGCGIVFGVSLVLSFTRGVWLALAVAGPYLVWRWKRKLLLAGPGLVVAAMLFAPLGYSPASGVDRESITKLSTRGHVANGLGNDSGASLVGGRVRASRAAVPRVPSRRRAGASARLLRPSSQYLRSLRRRARPSCLVHASVADGRGAERPPPGAEETTLGPKRPALRASRRQSRQPWEFW